MARIRHIALLTKDTEKLAEFYRASFGLKEVARSGEGTRSMGGRFISPTGTSIWRSSRRAIDVRVFTTSAWKSKT